MVIVRVDRRLVKLAEQRVFFPPDVCVFFLDLKWDNVMNQVFCQAHLKWDVISGVFPAIPLG